MAQLVVGDVPEWAVMRRVESYSANGSNAVPPALGTIQFLIAAAHAMVGRDQILGGTVSGDNEFLAERRECCRGGNPQRATDNVAAVTLDNGLAVCLRS